MVIMNVSELDELNDMLLDESVVVLGNLIKSSVRLRVQPI